MERPARWHTYVYPLHLERTEGCIYIGISIVGFHTDSTPPATLFQDSWVAHACWSFAPPLHPCSSAAGKPLRRSDAIITLPSSPFLPMHLLTLSTTFAPRALSNVRAYCIPEESFPIRFSRSHGYFKACRVRLHSPNQPFVLI